MKFIKKVGIRWILKIVALLCILIFRIYSVWLVGEPITNIITFLLFLPFLILLWKLYKKNYLKRKSKAYPAYNYLRNISKIVWIGFALFGILASGFILGATSESNYKKDEVVKNQNLKTAQLTDVLENYQGLSGLFYIQQQDMDIIIDPTIWQDDPQQFTDAVTSYKKERNEILFQWGKLYELRLKAGLPKDSNLKVD